MAERVIRHKLCQTKGCPTRRKDFQGDPVEWHIPWCQDIKGHTCFGGPTHQHIPKKGMGGHNPESEIVACLCAGAHDKIDNGLWGNAVIDVPGVGKVYRIWDVRKKPPLLERIIEAAPEALTPEQEDALEQLSPRAWNEEEPEEVLPAVKEERPAVQYEAVGLRLPENLTREQWEEVADTIQQMVVSVPWWVGDVLVYGQRYGEEMWQAIKEHGGADYERLRKYMWVAEKVPIGTRVPALKWSHHREVADLEPDEQRVWLQRAQDEELSANALRKAISGEEPEPPCPNYEDGKHRFVCACGKEKG